jgi:hypothetical protein
MLRRSAASIFSMANIVEFAPSYAHASAADYHHVRGNWNAHERTSRVATERGHRYFIAPADPETFGVSEGAVDQLIADADAVIFAPSANSPIGMWQPLDPEESGRLLGHRFLDRLSERHPDVHVVLVSHFLVGHGVTHKNAKPNTWALRALESHLRGGRNPWTILRATWLSQIHDESYQTRLTQDPFTDGLSSTESIADAVITSIEHPEAATGRTAAVFNLSIPETGTTDLVAQFTALKPDYEADLRESSPSLRSPLVAAL